MDVCSDPFISGYIIHISLYGDQKDILSYLEITECFKIESGMDADSTR